MAFLFVENLFIFKTFFVELNSSCTNPTKCKKPEQKQSALELY